MLRSSEFGTMKPLMILPSSANSTTKCSERIITSPTKHLQQHHHSSPMNNYSQTMHEIADLIFDSWYLAGAEFLTLCPKNDKIKDNTETAVMAVRCYYARGAMPYIKTLNYPNLQRWQNATSISLYSKKFLRFLLCTKPRSLVSVTSVLVLQKLQSKQQQTVGVKAKGAEILRKNFGGQKCPL